MNHFDKLLEEALAAQPTSPTKPKPAEPKTPKPGKPSPWNPPKPKQVPQPKNAEPGAPTKPRPAEPKTPRPDKPSPWNPPRPKQLPQPKNVARESVLETFVFLEDYASETHPSTQQFWGGIRGGSHRFAKHPILAMFGDELSKASWEHTKERAREAGVDIRQMAHIFMQIVRIEQQHTAELVELAKRITVKIWGIPEGMLEGQLGQDADIEVNTESDPDFEEFEGELSPDVGKHVNKRITMNTLTQGSAVHAMLTMHHAVDKEINAIDPRLLQLYNQLAAAAHEQYWLIDIPQMFAMLGAQAVGSAKVEYPEEEEQDELEQPAEGPRVVAAAVCFPVLAQEMSKGVAELLSHHGLTNLSSADTGEVLARADDIRHEPYMIQVGPELWRRFLKVRPRDVPLADIMHALAMQEPDDVHAIIAATVEDPERARTMLAQLVAEPEEFMDDDEGEEESWDTGSGWRD